MVVTSPLFGVTKVERTTPAYSGVWFGEAARTAAPSRRAATVLLSLSGGEAGRIVGTIAYASLVCGGELWLIGMLGDAALLGEHITYGRDRCESHGVVSTRVRPDGRLEYERRTGEEPHGAEATGVLDRRQ
jgi:hypothetical protein